LYVPQEQRLNPHALLALKACSPPQDGLKEGLKEGFLGVLYGWLNMRVEGALLRHAWHAMPKTPTTRKRGRIDNFTLKNGDLR
jgi:hypothetical protein